MSTLKLYTLEERQLIEKMIREGKKLSEMSKILSRSRYSVKNEIYKNGGKENYNSEKAQERFEMNKQKNYAILRENNNNYKSARCSDNQREKIKEYFLKGLSITTISYEVRCAHKTVQKVLNEMGLEFKTAKDLEKRLNVIDTQLELIFEILEEMKNGRINEGL